MTVSRVCGFARLLLVSGLAALTATGLTACSGGGSPAPTAATRTAGTTTPPPTTAPTGSPTARSGSPSTAPATTRPPATSSPPPAATAIRTFAPFDPATGKSAIRIAAARTGYCWTGSIALDARNAYRCMADNLILDPCFTNPRRSGGPLVCVDTPWDTGAALTLDRPLPSSPNTGPPQPGWALQLVNGARCVAVTGTVNFVGRVPMNYLCGAGGAQAGGLRHGGTPWTVDYLAPHSTALTRVGVATVWG